MPSVSAKQHRAMEAAAHGKSNLGIPKKVGEEYAEAGKNDSEPAEKKKKYKKGAKGFHDFFHDYMKQPGL